MDENRQGHLIFAGQGDDRYQDAPLLTVRSWFDWLTMSGLHSIITGHGDDNRLVLRSRAAGEEVSGWSAMMSGT